jgi:hypothetical protein
VTGCILYAQPLADFAARHPERCFYPETGFGAQMQPAWRIVAHESRTKGLRIAYAGGNTPYYLLGPDFRNEAVYVNVDRHRDWLPHDYHAARRARGKSERSKIPWPQWYREQPDYRAWLDNLRFGKIDLLFVSRINLHGRHSEAPFELPEFPVERDWADSHPDEFEDLGPQPEMDGPIPWARVYRLRQSSDRSPAEAR